MRLVAALFVPIFYFKLFFKNNKGDLKKKKNGATTGPRHGPDQQRGRGWCGETDPLAPRLRGGHPVRLHASFDAWVVD